MFTHSLRMFVFFVVIGSMLFAAPVTEKSETSDERVIAIGGTVTEIVYALNAEDRLVAVDVTSLYPPEALQTLPSVGNIREISAENVLALRPDLIITTRDIGPPESVELIESGGIRIEYLELENTLKATINAILYAGSLLNRFEMAESIATELERQFQETQKLIPADNADVTVAFVYARGAGTMLVSGRDTSADAMISLAGASNAVSEYTDYKPLTPESLIAKNPDYLLFTTSGLTSLGSMDGLNSIAALAELDAVKEGRIIEMDDLLLLGFGPRLGQAVYALAEKIHQ